MNIFLVGFMGSGKSFLGRQLAQKLNYSFIETDDWIAHGEGKSISRIFLDEGETYFRNKEAEFLYYLQTVQFCIIATGGGMPCYANNMDRMNAMGITLWLDTEEEILLERLEKQKEHRPMLANANDLKTSIHRLLDNRRLFYHMAHAIIKNPTIDSLFSVASPIVNRQSSIVNQ
jgi:shikimate kinase